MRHNESGEMRVLSNKYRGKTTFWQFVNKKLSYHINNYYRVINNERHKKWYNMSTRKRGCCIDIQKRVY